ncbi:MAG TPA: VTT domain-containing protein [Bryobacteraceae bacterium]|jgi:membrane protein DedA with SNARE-associated domain|nr:VTT domain-containing protein [Bryobacteraceae bacterium]
MHGIIPFLLRHGYWVLFANVLAEQAGLPVPAIPVMLAMGALVGLGNFSFTGALAVALSAALASDLMWFRLGRVRGHSILNLLCRISLEPDSCVSNIQTVFRKFGALALVFAKFVPGLNTAAAPMAGLTRMPLLKFLAADIAGVIAWSGSSLAVGYLFRNQLEDAAEYVGRMGSWLVLVLIILLAGYIVWKYYQRQRFIRELRIDRVTPEELLKMIESGEDLAVVDLRRALEVIHDNSKVPGAIWIDLDELEAREQEIPREKDVILYCS